MGVLGNILSLSNLTSGGKIILLVLHCYADGDNKCWLSDYELARLTGMHPKSMQKILGKLRRAGHITRTYDEDRNRYLIPQTLAEE